MVMLIMKVCYFGAYAPKYPRNRVILKGLIKNGVDVIGCQVGSHVLLTRYIRLASKSRGEHDIMVVSATPGYGQVYLPLAKLVSRKPLVLDLFLGLYETVVVDRGWVKEGSMRAKLYYNLDKFTLKGADLIVVDTDTHAHYFSKEFGLDRSGFRRIFVGSDDDVFYPRPLKRSDDSFLVMFWGTYIPLQGVEYIVKAAKILESERDIKFEIIGSGQTYEEVIKLSTQLKTNNVSFISEWIDYEKLPNHIAKADICLGIFGETDKAYRIIPNKVYESLAMKKPLITGDSPAIREVLRDKENCILCEMANPKAIASSVRLLKNNEKLRKKIARNGHTLFKQRFTSKIIGESVKKTLEELCK